MARGQGLSVQFDVNEPSKSPLVSLIIVCHNDGKWLPRCLESVRQQTIFDRIEVIIADNASEDGSDQQAQRLIRSWPNARFLSTGGDNGFCVGANRAASVASGTYLCMLNPDTWLETDFVENLLTTVGREHAGAGGPTILNYDDNSLQSECPAGFDFCGNLLLPRAGRRSNAPFSPGGFFFVRRDLFVNIGMLDEKLFMYCEEMDVAWRIWIAGERVVSVPGARIHHRGAVGVNPSEATVAAGNRTTLQKRFLANRNRLLVTAKNCQHLLLLMLVPCTLLILLEGLATWMMTRSWSLAKGTALDPLTDFWRLHGHVLEQRRRIASFRRHGDFWMLRFFRFGFGRWEEVVKISRSGFPRFK